MSFFRIFLAKFTLRKTLISMLQVAVLTYIGVVIALYFMQDRLVFRVYGVPDLATAHLPMAKELFVETEDGLRLLTWYAPPAVKNGPMILYLHGNGSHIGFRRDIAKKFIDQGFGVMLLEWRGYGGNPGKPSVDGLVLDAEGAYRYLLDSGIGMNRLYVYGESIGGAVALKMLARHPEWKAPGLILYAPFTRIGDVAKRLYPWAPVGLLMKHNMDNIATVQQVHVPLLVMHGGADGFVPVDMGYAVMDAANQPKQLWIEAESNHYSLWRRGGIERAIEFIRERESTPRGKVGGAQQ